MVGKRFIAGVSGSVFLPWILGAQSAPISLTEADYARAESYLAAAVNPLVHGTAGAVTWLADGRFWYRVSRSEGAEYRLVDPRRRTSVALFDNARLAQAITVSISENISAGDIPLQNVRVSDVADAISATVRGKALSCDLRSYVCGQQVARMGPPPASSVSPDGKTAVFIRNNNLVAKNLDDGVETVLTTDGEPDFGYATNNAGWTHNNNPILTWSPDSRSFATFQHDSRGVNNMYLVSTNVGSPALQSWKYPLPGDSVVFSVSRVVVRLDAPSGGQRVVRLRMSPDAHRSTVSDHIACGGRICDVQWFADASKLAFISSSRDHKQAWFRIADPASGEVRTVLHETSDTHIGDASLAEDLWKVLPATNELIWWSQRDGWVNLYLYDLTTGQLKNRITQGEGNVSRVLRVDERRREIWFMANGKEQNVDPYFQYLYKVRFDGSRQTLLTPDEGNHTVQISPDGRFVVDTWSTPQTAPVFVLRDDRGRVVQELERTDISRLLARGWAAPVSFTVKARDGVTDLYGLMFTPSNLDSSRRYPIINYIYPGPQSGSVGTRNFAAARSDHRALAELGFVVVAIDGMGTPGRSKKFHDFYYGRMGDNTIPDQVAGMRQLADRYRFIDIDKAGMWGHSGGGFATAAAMFQAPDFFKVGISESGNHDNRNYEDDWGERYQGLLVRSGGTDNYDQEANQTHAANLKGKLFLIHGMMDDNVPPWNTLLVADALMKAGKDFDMLMLPHARHGFGVDGPYIMRRRWDYFVRHLQGNEPPREYQIGR